VRRRHLELGLHKEAQQILRNLTVLQMSSRTEFEK
jgi:hypothetical protein